MEQFFKIGALSGLILFWIGLEISAAGDEICLQPPNFERCPGQNATRRFHYSAKTLRCIHIPASGCDKSQNNFATLQECNAKCGHLATKAFEEMILEIQKAEEKECYFKGKVYKSGENFVVEDPCSDDDCSCLDGRIQCSSGTCPIDGEEYDPSCTRMRKKDSCCDECIPNAEVQKMFKCKVDGKEYAEEQVFRPQDFPCLRCTCTRNFTVLSMADCEIERCHSISGDGFNSKMRKGCAPLYEKETDCCPQFSDFWKCA